MDNKSIVIATIKSWNVKKYRCFKPPVGFKKYLISSKDQLTYERLQKLQPRYVFFPHWSWIIPSEVYDNFECVLFHMTDVPFGRGGSPLQNLIVRGIYQTKISALRVVKELDAGPVYLQRPFNLTSGSARELYKKGCKIVFNMICEILTKNLKPKPQRGKVTAFKRRTSQESRIPLGLTGCQLYDFIRMLDAEGYPHAFIEENGRRFEFTNAQLKNDVLTATVTIKPG